MTATPPNYKYDVTVDSKGVFTITPIDGAPESPITVTERNTTITYTLTDNTESNMVFVSPQISDDPNDNLTWQFENAGRTIVITDSDASSEDQICVKLVTGFVSPDPQVKNKPPV